MKMTLHHHHPLFEQVFIAFFLSGEKLTSFFKKHVGSDFCIFKAVQSFYLFLGIKKNWHSGVFQKMSNIFTKFKVNHKNIINLAENNFEIWNCIYLFSTYPRSIKFAWMPLLIFFGQKYFAFQKNALSAQHAGL